MIQRQQGTFSVHHSHCCVSAISHIQLGDSSIIRLNRAHDRPYASKSTHSGDTSWNERGNRLRLEWAWSRGHRCCCCCLKLFELLIDEQPQLRNLSYRCDQPPQTVTAQVCCAHLSLSPLAALVIDVRSTDRYLFALRLHALLRQAFLLLLSGGIHKVHVCLQFSACIACYIHISKYILNTGGMVYA